MATKDKANKWFSTPASKRKRKEIKLTLGDEATETLTALAEELGVSRSQVVERAIVEFARSKS